MKVIGVMALTCCVLSAARAEDASGTWYWVNPGRNGGPDRTNTLTLKVQAGAVTGALAVPGRGQTVTKLDIADATLTGDALSFKVSRERNGTTTTMTYTGKVAADAIEGTVKQQTGDNEPRTRPWKAKRQPSSS